LKDVALALETDRENQKSIKSKFEKFENQRMQEIKLGILYNGSDEESDQCSSDIDDE
jgi:hypothetical protein